MGQLVRSAVLLLVALTIAETVEINPDRIIGGQEVPPYSIKYQASIQYKGKHYCGATLIRPQWVVSAAHCWRPSTLITVVLSEHSLITVEGFEQAFNISKIHVHYNYNYKSFDNDIMLMKLSKPAKLNQNVEPVRIADNYTPHLRRGDICTVSGWGITRIYSYYLSPVLRAVDVQVINNCHYYYYWRITNNMMCAGSQFGGKDSCQGDSGGPLVCNGFFEGIVSWGISCANPYFPGVYTKVRQFAPWIDWMIRNDKIQ